MVDTVCPIHKTPLQALFYSSYCALCEHENGHWSWYKLFPSEHVSFNIASMCADYGIWMLCSRRKLDAIAKVNLILRMNPNTREVWVWYSEIADSIIRFRQSFWHASEMLFTYMRTFSVVDDGGYWQLSLFVSPTSP